MSFTRASRIAMFLCFGSVACQSGQTNEPTNTDEGSSEVLTSATGTSSEVTTGKTSASPSVTSGAAGSAPSSGATTSTTETSATTADETVMESSAESTSTATSEAPTSGGSSSASEAVNSSVGDVTSSVELAPCANTLLCDNFDDDTVGMEPGQPWTVAVNGGGIEISTERAFSGDKSVHVSNTQGAYKRAYFSVEGDPLFPAAGQEMYGRMMMWLEATPAGSVHWTFVQGEGPSEDGSYDIFYRYGGQHEGKLMANFETQGKATDCWDHSDTVMPTQTWSCLEWRFNVATDEMQFWLDGEEVADIHATGMGEGCVSQDLAGAWPAPAQFETLRLGWEKYQESAELNAWIDDVAVATERVGCPAP